MSEFRAIPASVFQIFAKAPVPGFAKTRLIPTLGAERSARLQAAFIRNSLDACSRAALQAAGAVELWCAPDCMDPFLRRCGVDFKASLHRQTGADLGARMCSALRAGLTRAHGAVLLGTDAPTITAEHLISAAQALTDGTDAVIAPAQDGGYVLIGLTRVEQGLFDDISWGTAYVFEQTRQRLQDFDYHWLELPAHRDIDRPEDWAALLADAPEWQQRLDER